MIRSLLRTVGAITASLIVGFALIMAVEVVTLFFHPFPPGVDPNDMEVCKVHVAKFPLRRRDPLPHRIFQYLGEVDERIHVGDKCLRWRKVSYYGNKDDAERTYYCGP